MPWKSIVCLQCGLVGYEISAQHLTQADPVNLYGALPIMSVAGRLSKGVIRKGVEEVLAWKRSIPMTVTCSPSLEPAAEATNNEGEEETSHNSASHQDA